MAEPTSNSEAYDLYLRGRDYLTRAREVMSPEDGEFAVGSFRDAVALDPAFAVAHAQLAVAHSWLWDRYMDRSDSRVALARQAVDEALRLDPTLPEAHYALALVYAAEGKREAARAEHLNLLDRQPDNAEVHEALANVLGELGEHEASYASNVRAADLNPRVGSLLVTAAPTAAPTAPGRRTTGRADRRAATVGRAARRSTGRTLGQRVAPPDAPRAEGGRREAGGQRAAA